MESRSTIVGEINATFPTNNNNFITAERVRAFMDVINESKFNLIDDNLLELEVAPGITLPQYLIGVSIENVDDNELRIIGTPGAEVTFNFFHSVVDSVLSDDGFTTFRNSNILDTNNNTIENWEHQGSGRSDNGRVYRQFGGTPGQLDDWSGDQIWDGSNNFYMPDDYFATLHGGVGIPEFTNAVRYTRTIPPNGILDLRDTWYFEQGVNSYPSNNNNFIQMEFAIELISANNSFIPSTALIFKSVNQNFNFS